MNFKNFYLRMGKLSLLMTVLSFGVSGCTTWDYVANGFMTDEEVEEAKPHFTVSFYQAATSGRTDALKRNIEEDVDGELIQVPLNKISLLDSKLIDDIGAFPDGLGTYMLVLTLDKHALVRWQGYSAKYNGQPLAVVVEKKIVGWWYVETMRDRHDPVEVFCKLDKELAENIAKHAKDNHEKLNKKTFNY